MGNGIGPSPATFEGEMLAATDSKSAWNAWALVLVLAITLGGGAWILAWTLSTNFVRLGAAIERNHDAVERNGVAIARNGKAIERNALAIGRNAQAIERNAQAIERNATAIAQVQESVAANGMAIEVNRSAIGANAAAIAKVAGQFAEHTRQHDRVASR